MFVLITFRVLEPFIGVSANALSVAVQLYSNDSMTLKVSLASATATDIRPNSTNKFKVTNNHSTTQKDVNHTHSKLYHPASVLLKRKISSSWAMRRMI
jgi:hypothetical protein